MTSTLSARCAPTPLVTTGSAGLVPSQPRREFDGAVVGCSRVQGQMGLRRRRARKHLDRQVANRLQAPASSCECARSRGGDGSQTPGTSRVGAAREHGQALKMGTGPVGSTHRVVDPTHKSKANGPYGPASNLIRVQRSRSLPTQWVGWVDPKQLYHPT